MIFIFTFNDFHLVELEMISHKQKKTKHYKRKRILEYLMDLSNRGTETSAAFGWFRE